MKKTQRWKDTSTPVHSFGIKLGLDTAQDLTIFPLPVPSAMLLQCMLPSPVKNAGYTVHGRELPVGTDSGYLREGSRPLHQLLLVSLEKSVFSRRNPEWWVLIPSNQKHSCHPWRKKETAQQRLWRKNELRPGRSWIWASCVLQAKFQGLEPPPHPVFCSRDPFCVLKTHPRH